MTNKTIYEFLTEERIKNFQPTWLYIKRHKITGFLYFGKTTQDIQKYSGSGLHWVRHIRKHGLYIEDIWYCYFTCPFELAKTAISLQNQMNIVEDTSWANMRPENGFDGGCVGMKRSKESNLKLSISIKGKKKPPRQKEHREKLSHSQKGVPKPGSGPKKGQRPKKETIPKIKRGKERRLYFLSFSILVNEYSDMCIELLQQGWNFSKTLDDKLYCESMRRKKISDSQKSNPRIYTEEEKRSAAEKTKKSWELRRIQSGILS